jgi:hypothetical protein
MTDCPSCTESCSTTARGTRSEVLAAATGTMKRIGLAGHACAWACTTDQARMAAGKIRRRKWIMTFSLKRRVTANNVNRAPMLVQERLGVQYRISLHFDADPA